MARQCGFRIDGIMEQTLVTMCCPLDGSTVVAWKLKADYPSQLYLHCAKMAILAYFVLLAGYHCLVTKLDGWHHKIDGTHDVKSGWLNSCGCQMDCPMEYRQQSRCAVRWTAQKSRLAN
ncbi:hypothetical protein OS493_038225 [Desmophyllum pertusum]|uniref:Uncharacterized protein n=1 Tax=Desmophyllum pertusum TaxID=174260 RepID=A0A9X0CCJ1_9CNID|nr:hypothetical protein OS493_038225 [Desmophyllum pertusum]